MEQKQAAVFLADYEHQVAQIHKIYAILERKASFFNTLSISSEMVESTGYWLHNLYCALKIYLKLLQHFGKIRSHRQSFLQGTLTANGF